MLEVHPDLRVVDIGARDASLKDLCPVSSRYLSIDLCQNKSSSIDIVADASQLDYSFIESSDAIFALDVLEHVDDMHGLMRRLFESSASHFVFCFPNTGFIKYRLNYLLFGTLPGNKYRIVGTSSRIDRHRWLTPSLRFVY